MFQPMRSGWNYTGKKTGIQHVTDILRILTANSLVLLSRDTCAIHLSAAAALLLLRSRQAVNLNVGVGPNRLQ